MDDARFGLPLSLEEALRVDHSPLAVLLADLMSESEPKSRLARRGVRRTRAGMAFIHDPELVERPDRARGADARELAHTGAGHVS